MVEIRMLGALEILVDGAPHAFSAPPRTLPLFGYLMLARGRPVARDEAAFLLWPDALEEDARTDLRRHLYYLAKALPEANARPWFRADKKFITWDGEGRARFDVAEFEALIRDAGRLDEAVAFYRGPLLAGVGDEWVEPERARLESAVLDALHRAIQRYRDREPARAIDAARRMLRIDPWREDALRASIEARYRSGDRAGALGEYRDFEKRVRAELDVSPMPETRALYERIASGDAILAPQIAAPGRLVSSDVSKTSADSDSHDTNSLVTGDIDSRSRVITARDARRSRSGNLPLASSPLIGRETLIGEITETLNRYRLMTLTGAGGVGKTAVALEVARRASDHFTGGAWLVDFTSARDSSAVSETMARALGRKPDEEAISPEALADSFASDNLLLVLDNCEGVIDGAARAMRAIEERCPNVRVLATSRERANIGGEYVVRVPSLDAERARDLFIERAARVAPHFARDAHSDAKISEIIDALDGIALALELAAARVATLGIDGVAAHVGERLKFLVGGDRTQPSRRRTMRAAIEWSYELLDDDERRAFVALGVWHGWAPDRARAYFEALGFGARSDALLETLCEKSLVVVENGDHVANDVRHRMLETLRAFALEKLAERDDAAAIERVFIDAILAFAHSLDAQRETLDDARWFALARSEWKNVRAVYALLARRFDDELDDAARLAVARGARIVAAYGPAWPNLAGSAERAMTATLLERSMKIASANESARVALAVARSAPLGNTARLASAHAVTLARRSSDRDLLAETLGTFGESLIDAGRFDEARVAFEESFALLLSHGSSKATAVAIARVGIAAARAGELDVARRHFDRAAAIARETGAFAIVGTIDRERSLLAFAAGDLARAKDLSLHARAAFELVGFEHAAVAARADLAAFETARGEFEAVRAEARAAHAVARRLGDAVVARAALERAAVVLGLEGQFEQAARLLGYVDAKRWQLGVAVDAVIDRPGYDRLIAALTSALSSSELVALSAEGAEFTAIAAEELAFRS